MNISQERSDRFHQVEELVEQIQSIPVRKYAGRKLAEYINPSATLYFQNDDWLDKFEDIVNEIISDECKHFDTKNAVNRKKVN